ncbi:unnamed protein product [Trichobilharzia szidati]|nr:unnamed protein product [Trichobilharzia szidati]
MITMTTVHERLLMAYLYLCTIYLTVFVNGENYPSPLTINNIDTKPDLHEDKPLILLSLLKSMKPHQFLHYLHTMQRNEKSHHLSPLSNYDYDHEQNQNQPEHQQQYGQGHYVNLNLPSNHLLEPVIKRRIEMNFNDNPNTNIDNSFDSGNLASRGWRPQRYG